jgi:hypothetical protein
MKKLYFLLFGLFLSMSISAQTQASNVQITYKTTSGATVSWTRGSGNACIVVIRKLSSSQVAPPSSTTSNYSASGIYGNGTSLGASDNFLVYEGTGTSVFVSSLVANTAYYAYVYEYVTIQSFPSVIYAYNNSTSSANYEQFYTLDTSPSAVASISSVTPSYTNASIFSTTGTGADGRLIYVRPSTGTNVYPTDGYHYPASSTYGGGSALGGGYAVYAGSGTSVGVTNLQPATLYYAYSHAFSNGTFPTSSSYAVNTKNYVSGSSYAFYTLNNPPTINAVSSVTVCQNASQQTINLSGISDGSTAESQTISVSAVSNNTGLIPNPAITYSSPASGATLKYTPVAGQSGTAIITVTVNDGWHTANTAIATFTITVRPIPAAAGVISGSTPICAGTSATYTVPAIANATTYNWSVPANYTITAGLGTPTVTIATSASTPSGNIGVYGSNTFGCGNGTVSTKSIQVDAQASTPDAGLDQPLVCSGTTFLTATSVASGNTGAWTWLSGTPVPSIGNASSNSTSLSGLTSPQTYQYIWTVTKTGSVCPPKKDTITITTNFANVACAPAANFSYSPLSDVTIPVITVCKNSTLNFTDLSVGNPDTWEWDFNYNGSMPNYTSTLQNPSFTYNTVGTYTVYMRIHSTTTSLYYNTQKTITVIDAPATPGTVFGTSSAICAGNTTNQYTYSIASVTNATGYNWTTMTGGNIVANPSPNSIVLEYDNTAIPGNITVSASNSCGTSSTNSLMVNLTALPSAPGAISGPAIVCQGEQGVTYTVPTIVGATSYVWTALDGTNTNPVPATETFNIGLNEQNGRIYVKGKNSCGTGDSTDFAVTVNPLPANAGAITGTAFLQLCPTADAVSYDIDPVAYATSYTWILSNGAITSGTGTDSITVDFTGVTGTTSIQVVPTNACGTRDSSAAYIVNFNSLPIVDVCVATVDTASQYNEVYWVRPASSDIDSFRVYRRISALVDTLVGTVAYEDESYIVDTLSDYDPNSSLEQYTISAVDSCGNEGAKSAYHTTMFMSTSLGAGTVNLQWNLYIGQTVDFYKVYRDSFAVGGTWDLLDGAINPTATTWVDNNPVPGGGARYRIEIEWLTTCDPTRGAINTSRSNIKSPNSIGMKDITSANDIRLFPNPANAQVTLVFAKNNAFGSIQVADALGRVVYSDSINTSGTAYTFDVSSFAKGVYTVIASGPAGKTTKKLIVE